MRISPFVVAGSLVVAALAWFIELGTNPGRFATEPAMVLGIGVLLFALIAAFGLVFTGARWSRWLGIGLAGTSIIAAALVDPSGWVALAVVASAIALAGYLGPWLKGWVRERPSAEGPGTKPTLLAFGALGLIPLVAIASPAGLDLAHGVLAGIGAFLAWAYVRANLWALWALRFVLVILAVPAMISSPPLGAALIAVWVGGLTWLAWSKEARRAVTPLMEKLPPPRIGTPKEDR